MKTLALAGLVLSFMGSGSSGWTTFTFQGITVQLPKRWYVIANPLTPVTDPPSPFSMASFPFPTDPRPNGCRPTGTLAARQPSGVVFFVIEYDPLRAKARSFPKRRSEFIDLPGVRNYECFGRSSQVRFRKAGRYFQIHIAFGRDAGPAQRRTALRILNSFSASPR